MRLRILDCSHNDLVHICQEIDPNGNPTGNRKQFDFGVDGWDAGRALVGKVVTVGQAIPMVYMANITTIEGEESMLVLGFGEHHRQITIEFCNKLAEAVSASSDITETANHLANELGTWKEKPWRIAIIQRAETLQIYEGAIISVVEGTYSHYRDDHPMSPDGFASFTMSWCVTICEDEIWGKRVYVSV